MSNTGKDRPEAKKVSDQEVFEARQTSETLKKEDHRDL